MSKNFPISVSAAVDFGLGLLDAKSKKELASIGLYNPHMRYDTNFAAVISEGLGIANGRNPSLLRDIAINYRDELHFLEADGDSVEANAALRVVLSAMSKVLTGC